MGLGGDSDSEFLARAQVTWMLLDFARHCDQQMAGLSICKVEHDLAGSEQDWAHCVTESHSNKRHREQGETSRRWSDQESGWLFGH